MILRILRVLGLSSTANAPANYTAVNEGRLEFTADGDAVQAPLVHLIDEGGNSIAPLTADELASTTLETRQLSASTDSVLVEGTFWQETQPVSATALPLPTGAATEASLGTDGATPPSIVGTGVRGWLRGIYEKGVTLVAGQVTSNTTTNAIKLKLDSLSTADYQVESNTWLGNIDDKLNKNANGNLSTAIAEPLPAGTNAIGEVKTVRKTSEAVAYSAVMSLLPTTLTQNTTYGCIRNPSSNKTIKIKRINLSLVFGGTATAGRNFFWIRRVTASAMSGATSVDVAKFSSAAAAPVAQVGSSNAGITFTSGVLDAGGLGIFSVATQLSGATLYSEDFSDAPIVLAQSEGLVLQGLSGTLVAGTSAFLTFEWTEE